MTDRIVDSDLDNLDEVNHNDLEQQLKGEQTTTSEEPTPEEQSELVCPVWLDGWMDGRGVCCDEERCIDTLGRMGE